MNARLALAALGALLLVGGCGGSAPPVQVERPNADIAAPLEIDGQTLGRAESAVRLRAEDGGEFVVQSAPALWQAPDTARDLTETAYCGSLPADLNAGSYDLHAVDAPHPTFSFSEEGGRLLLSEGERPVLAYNFGTQLQEGLPQENARSTYLHPIWDLDGTVITDDFPEDHLHHRGLSWMWPRVIHDGQEYDVWALRGMEQVFDEWLYREAGPACATIGVKNHWALMEEDRAVVDEWVWVRAYPADEYGRAIDVRITLEAREPIRFAGREDGNKGYGGLSLRFAPREETVIVSEDGPEPEDSDLKPLAWADQSARFGGADSPSGMAIFQHEAHPDFPAGWTLRYYGFLGVAWPGLDWYTLRPGEPLTLRYRVWVHRGSAEDGRVAEAYDAFANPPLVSSR